MVNDLYFQGVGMTSQRTRSRLVERLREQGIRNMAVLELMSRTPRHAFLDEALAHRAYEDTALPIGHGQTLSQPYIVARMTELLLQHSTSLNKVLEVGTGSGYQTAILSQIAEQVWSVERIKPLQEKARQRLQQLKAYNVQLRLADGCFGLKSQAPYDAILSAAAPSTLPEELKEQLGPDGVLVIPVGDEQQRLYLVKRLGDSQEFEQRKIEPVKFVPLLSGVSK